MVAFIFKPAFFSHHCQSWCYSRFWESAALQVYRQISSCANLHLIAVWPKTVLDVVVTDHLISSHPNLKALLCIFACLFGYSAGFPNLPFSRSPQTLWSFFPLLPGKLLWFLIHYTWSSVRVHLASCYLCLRNPCPDFAVSSCFVFFSLLDSLVIDTAYGSWLLCANEVL